jgi:predicted alpha/beta-hydrolase family hydrolase
MRRDDASLIGPPILARAFDFMGNDRSGQSFAYDRLQGERTCNFASRPRRGVAHGIKHEGLSFLLAPGAGAPSSHPRLQALAGLLGPLGAVRAFDYAYMLAGRKRPDPLPQLIERHRAALAEVAGVETQKVVLAGKSMGGRVGRHVALETPVAALICFGYPLCGAGDRAKLRDKVLIDLRTPILFVQGTRDALCPLDLLEDVRGKMTAPSHLHIVSGGDHSLVASKTELKATGLSQSDVDLKIREAVAVFLRTLRLS